MQPQQLGDGDILGDGIEGAPTPENQEDPETQAMEGMEQEAEAQVRNKLVTDAYGTKLPQRRSVDKE
jgi:hypothetical protein